MKSHFASTKFIRIPLLSVSFALWGATGAFAAPCDDISRDVADAVSKDPSKVLMVVEDALVINESCACEIVRAAIAASKANAETVNQITQTAISVAPKMSAVIMDCVNSTRPEAAVTEAEITAEMTPSGKEAKNPSAKAALGEEDANRSAVSPEAAASDPDYVMPASIRGVYLMQPPAGGFIPPSTTKKGGSGRDHGKKPISPNHNYPGYP